MGQEPDVKGEISTLIGNLISVASDLTDMSRLVCFVDVKRYRILWYSN
jgi:hypothetical protein